jgi:SAM-dependent methyltransferase
MNLLEIVNRTKTPAPWAEGDNIPWNDPDFSRRMLKEHLTQDHEHASRRFETIDRHVAWIAREALGQPPARLLDMGCGPGLYCQRFAALGYACHGIDFSPASIEHARQQQGGLPIDYQLADLRTADFGPDGSFDCAMLIYGELNVFKPADARLILGKAWAALKPGGRLVLEPATETLVSEMGAEGITWWASQAGLFGDQPHIMLSESFWDEATRAATTRYHRIDAATGEVVRYATSQQAYSQDEYCALLAECGFHSPRFFPGLAAAPGDPPGPFWGIIAEK